METGERADMGSDDAHAASRGHRRSAEDERVPVANLISPVTPAGPAAAIARRNLRPAEGGPDLRLLKTLASVKDVMKEMLELLNRNTIAVVQVRESVTNLSVALETCMRLDERTRNPKADTGEESPSIKDVASISEPSRAESAAIKTPSCLEPHTAFIIYSQALEAVRIGNPGDGNLFPAQKAWTRLCYDFPVVSGTHRRLLPCAFCGSALTIYETIAAENLHFSAEELWTELGHRLCNASHRRALRLQFDTIAWRETKETINEFAGRVRTAALMLRSTIPDEIMLDRFVQSLPANMRGLALSIPGTFDEVTARICMMALTRTAESIRTRFWHERVQQTSDRPTDGESGAASNGEQVRSGLSANWIETAKCYRCGRKGHLAADCPENRSELGAGRCHPRGRGRAAPGVARRSCPYQN